MNTELQHVESKLGVAFPQSHRQAILDAQDPIHDACDFLVLASQYPLLRLVEVNELLHSLDWWTRWPEFLVAFASNGCGDYFAYDLREQPPSIIYMDPDLTVDENLASHDKLVYSTFDEWYLERIKRWTARKKP